MTSGCYSLFFYNFSCLEFGFYLSGIAAARELQPGRADKVVKKHYDVLWRVDFERGLFLEFLKDSEHFLSLQTVTKSVTSC